MGGKSPTNFLFVAHGDPRERCGCLDFFSQDWNFVPCVGLVHCLLLGGLDLLLPVAARTELGSQCCSRFVNGHPLFTGTFSAGLSVWTIFGPAVASVFGEHPHFWIFGYLFTISLFTRVHCHPG